MRCPIQLTCEMCCPAFPLSNYNSARLSQHVYLPYLGTEVPPQVPAHRFAPKAPGNTYWSCRTDEEGSRRQSTYRSWCWEPSSLVPRPLDPGSSLSFSFQPPHEMTGYRMATRAQVLGLLAAGISTTPPGPSKGHPRPNWTTATWAT